MRALLVLVADVGGFTWLRTGYWPVLLLVPVLAACLWYGAKRRRRAFGALMSSTRLAKFAPWRDPRRSAVRAGLGLAALAFGGIALIGPVMGFVERRAIERGVDLVVCLDTSRSMLARDLKPSRFDRALREIRGLLDAARGDRVALLAFAGDAREIAPLTNDRRVLADLLDTIEMADNRLGGTDIGAALERALAMFDGRTGAHEAIVVLTDGEDLSGRAREIAEQAGERGIRVYVVGLGTLAGGKIPYSQADGTEQFVVGPEGEEVVSRLEDETLEALAEVTDGAYTSTERSPNPLEELYERRIADLDEREIEGGVERVPNDRYQWPLALALLLALIEAGLRESRPRRLDARNSAGRTAA